MNLKWASHSTSVTHAAVEVTIWEGYLLKNRTNIARMLCAYSLDNGPWHETDDARFIFRFSWFDWSNIIRAMLDREHIHCDGVRRFDINLQAAAKRIALVGYHPESACELTTGLEAAAYHVEHYCTGNALIERCCGPVDLFIVDKQSSDIDGLSICRYLRTHPSTRDIPVILLSAEAKKRKEALLAGATDYVRKPVHVHYLLNVIATHIRRNS